MLEEPSFSNILHNPNAITGLQELRFGVFG
jgi:hypothetical protein